jgi:hypothetical protein
MIGFTDHEKALAVERGGHAAAFGLALAELSMYWDNHSSGAPDMHQPVLNIRIEPGTAVQDGIDTVKAVADWLGVEVETRYEVHIAQRRFGTGNDSIIVECHYTPDQDRTHALIRAAGKRREVPAPREDEAERPLVSAA